MGLVMETLRSRHSAFYTSARTRQSPSAAASCDLASGVGWPSVAAAVALNELVILMTGSVPKADRGGIMVVVSEGCAFALGAHGPIVAITVRMKPPSMNANRRNHCSSKITSSFLTASTLSRSRAQLRRKICGVAKHILH